MPTKSRVPVQVLARAKAAAVTSTRKPTPSQPPKAKKQLTPRERVVRALQKLHPMD
ncbi:MAG: hypothetical protein JNJ54_06675 [Myxococcaceae bacterium]|nr:hypothetical protein [Myxococcaceae bacterium]